MNVLFEGTNAAGFIRFTRPDYQPKYVIDSDRTNPGEEVGMLVDVLQKRMKKRKRSFYYNDEIHSCHPLTTDLQKSSLRLFFGSSLVFF